MALDSQICPLTIAQYAISGHPRRTEHWSLLAVVSKTEAHVYQLKGNYDSFCYEYEIHKTYMTDQSLRGGCTVGSISSSRLHWLKDTLSKEVTITRHDFNFDCQNWVMGAIQVLKDHGGIILAGTTERKIRAEMDEEKERWEVADDILFERLFP